MSNHDHNTLSAPIEENAPHSVPATHYVNGHALCPPFPAHMAQALFGMGCFWGAERLFWEHSGVYSTAVGYAGGHTPHPRYEDVCRGTTAHVEVVFVVFNPRQSTYLDMVRLFWENHDPTQGMRQGNDHGSQYRSVIYTFDSTQQEIAHASQVEYQAALKRAGYATITTEIAPAPPFYYAEAYHQQYLAKNPRGYCGHGGTGVRFSP
jgi:peptide-methionine (S)-S-oxide reductase